MIMEAKESHDLLSASTMYQDTSSLKASKPEQLMGLKMKFETTPDSLLLLAGGFCVSCRPLQLIKPTLLLAANHSREYLLGSSLRVIAGKARFFSITAQCVAELNGRPCP